jgi:HEPN domain-containing protein
MIYAEAWRTRIGFSVKSLPEERSSMKRQTKLWVRKAKDDIVGARSLERSKPALNDLICFHCQQCGEKYIKALVQELGLAVPRTHILEELLVLLRPHDSSIGRLRPSAVSLSRYAVQFRYPGKNASKRQALAALRHAESVRKEIRTRVDLPP